MAQAQPPNQHVAVRPGSQLALIGAYVYILRLRFQASEAGGKPLAWAWKPRIEETSIAIESAFNEDKAWKNKWPHLAVDIEQTQATTDAIGDRKDESILTHAERFYQLDSLYIVVDCVASKRGEAFVLSDMVRRFLQATSDRIQAAFGLHHQSPVVAGRAEPYAAENTKWKVSVRFMVQVPARWSTKPHEPVLREALLKFGQMGENITVRLEGIAKGHPEQP